MSLSYNDAPEKLLSEAGYKCEPEPDWVDGRVPDFLCTGATDFWAEVKSLDEPAELQMSRKASTWFRERLHKVGAEGRADAVVADDISERDIRTALAIANDVLAKPPPASEAEYQEHVVIPRDPIYGRHVCIKVRSSNGVEVIHCCKSISNVYGRPLFAGKIDSDAFATITEMDGREQQVRAEDLGILDDDFVLGLHLVREPGRFEIKSITSHNGAFRLPNVEKFRKAVREANSQFKSACQHRSLPCLLLVFHDGVLVSSDEAFLSSFYGDLQVTFSLNNRSPAPMSFGRNGAWSETKNRTTSAACYVRNGASPLLVHNYWAKLPLTWGLLDATEYAARDDGGTVDRLD